MRQTYKYTTLFFSLLILAAPSLAEKKGNSKRHGPPPEAIEICESKAENDSCSFEGRSHTVDGICLTKHEKIVCVPHRHIEKMKNRES